MRTLRIGIVGCGGIARVHLEAYRATPGVSVTHVYDPIEAAAQAFAKEAGARPVASLAGMIVAQVDAVSICTPPGFHAEACLPFIEAGIPILCEKPLAANLSESRQLAQAVSRRGTLFMTAFCHRFHGPIIELKRLIASGHLGKPVLFRNLFAGRLDLAGNHRGDPRLSGGGCLIDNGTHASDLFRFLVGEVTQVRGLISTVAQQIAVEDVGVMTLLADNGAIGELTASFSTPIGGNYVEWFGSEGTARVSYWMDGEPDLAWRRAGDKTWMPIDCSAHPSRFTAQALHFVECVRSGKPPCPSVEDGLAASSILAAAYQSARTTAVGMASG